MLARRCAVACLDRCNAYSCVLLARAREIGPGVAPKEATSVFDRLARKARISTTRLHDLRHTAATTLLVSGVDVEPFSGFLGRTAQHVGEALAFRLCRAY